LCINKPWVESEALRKVALLKLVSEIKLFKWAAEASIRYPVMTYSLPAYNQILMHQKQE
jgi:hypothetical protein